MNFTVDDADPSIAYSSDGWAVQSQDDPDLDQFFQETYHVATQDGATMSFQFSGSAFTLYGSKGPGHAKFQLQFDSTVVTLDASAETTAFRQELFSNSFSANGTAAQHLVKVTAILSGEGQWLDLDYITFTSSSGATTSSIETATSEPPWVTESSQTSQGATGSSTGPTGLTVPASSSASSSSTSKVPTILAALFGAVVGLALLGLLAWLVLRRVYAQRRARERAFRYGQSSVNPSSAAGPGPGSGAGGYLATSPSSASAPSAKSGGHASFSVPHDVSMRERTASPFSSHFSHGHGQRDGSMSMASNAFEMRSTASVDRERAAAGTPTTATGTGRPLLSQSPIAWTTRKMARDKGDADSLRTDFLQV